MSLAKARAWPKNGTEYFIICGSPAFPVGNVNHMTSATRAAMPAMTSNIEAASRTAAKLSKYIVALKSLIASNNGDEQNFAGDLNRAKTNMKELSSGQPALATH